MWRLVSEITTQQTPESPIISSMHQMGLETQLDSGSNDAESVQSDQLTERAQTSQSFQSFRQNPWIAQSDAQSEAQQHSHYSNGYIKYESVSRNRQNFQSQRLRLISRRSSLSEHLTEISLPQSRDVRTPTGQLSIVGAQINEMRVSPSLKLFQMENVLLGKLKQARKRYPSSDFLVPLDDPVEYPVLMSALYELFKSFCSRCKTEKNRLGSMPVEFAGLLTVTLEYPPVHEPRPAMEQWLSITAGNFRTALLSDHLSNSQSTYHDVLLATSTIISQYEEYRSLYDEVM
jgi:hypothetical protein